MRLDCDGGYRERALWSLEALLARAGVRSWEQVGAGDDADLVYAAGGDEVALPHDADAWRFQWDVEPDPVIDPLAATFWWLARVEELLAPQEAFDEHGRFRHASSALARRSDPLAVPVDDIAASLPVPERFRSPTPWLVVASHDIDQPWRWTRGGVRRAVRSVIANARAGRARAALATVAALSAVPWWRLRRDDPWCNAHRIRRLEGRHGARSTSYVLVDARAPQDGDPDMHLLGRDRYVRRLLEGSTRRPTAAERVGLHGSYTASSSPGQVAEERRALEKLAGISVVDHRFHYLRHTPAAAWADLARAGLRTDASLGYAEHPGFRAGTASPWRAWDHERGQPLDLVVIPLAFMDASLDERYLGLGCGDAARELQQRVLSRIAERRGAASILFHNDRLCTVDAHGWTRLYVRALQQVHEQGGAVVTAAEAATAYLSRLPAARLQHAGAAGSAGTGR